MLRVYYEVLNQKGSPALYSDTYANRPAAGYLGRVFFSPDTAQIFYDTGSTWTLLSDAGVGSGSLASVCANGNTTATGITITAGGLSANSVTATGLPQGSIVFAAAGGTLAQNNTNFFWDNSNFRLGINTNTPGAPLDIHGTNGTLAHLNGTGANNSYLLFQNAGVGKWRIGNTYSAGSNFFHLYNNSTATTILAIDQSNNFFFNSTAQYTFAGPILANNSLGFKEGVGISTTSGYTTFNAFKSGSTNTLGIVFGTGIEADLNFNNVATYSYTFPTASGTLALTSNLSSYLPLTGGTLSGALTINSTLYINPTNTGLTGLDVASDNISFRSDNLEGSKRQLLLTMNSGTLIQFTGQGYGAARTTDIAFYTSSSGGVNSTPIIYMTGGNAVGIGTGSPFAGGKQGLHIYLNGNSPYLRISSTSYTGIDMWQQYNTGNALLYNNDNASFSFGTNGSEGFKITTQNNLHVNGEIGANIPLCVIGKDSTSSNYAFRANNSSGTTLLSIRNDGVVSIGTISNLGGGNLEVITNGVSAYTARSSSTTGTNGGTTVVAIRSVDSVASFFANAQYNAWQHIFAVSGSTEAVRITNSGNVGIGESGPTAKLQVIGVDATSSNINTLLQNSVGTALFRVRNDGQILTGTAAASPINNTTASAANANIGAAGDLRVSTSSLKYKTDVLDYDKGLDIIKQMRPVYYKGINDGNKQFAGFIAEEIDNIGLYEFVDYATDNTPNALYYPNMTALLTKGIQQLDTRLTNVEEALLTLEQKLN